MIFGNKNSHRQCAYLQDFCGYCDSKCFYASFGDVYFSCSGMKLKSLHKSYDSIPIIQIQIQTGCICTNLLFLGELCIGLQKQIKSANLSVNRCADVCQKKLDFHKICQIKFFVFLNNYTCTKYWWICHKNPRTAFFLDTISINIFRDGFGSINFINYLHDICFLCSWCLMWYNGHDAFASNFWFSLIWFSLFWFSPILVFSYFVFPYFGPVFCLLLFSFPHTWCFP